MIESPSRKEHNIVGSRLPVSGHSQPLLLFRPRAHQNDGKASRDSGPLPPLRELVGKHESAVLTFTQIRMMGGCELVDFSLTSSNNKPADGARIDVDLALIGLRPEQLWSRLLLMKPDLQVTSSAAMLAYNKDQTIKPTLLMPRHHQVPYLMKEEVHNNEWQGKDLYTCSQPQDHDLFAVGYDPLTINNVPPSIANNNISISSNVCTDLPEDSSLQYFDLDTFQAEIVGLTQSNHQSAAQKVQHQTPRKKKDKAPSERNISCSQCPRKFRSAGHLKIHFNSAHPSDGTIRKCHCDICGKGFSHKGALALHKRRHTYSHHQAADNGNDNKRSKLIVKSTVDSGDQLVPQEFYL